MKSLSMSPKLKRRSTRHVSEITSIASEFGNSAKIIVPRSWLGYNVIPVNSNASEIIGRKSYHLLLKYLIG
ncbi:MAG: DUF2080 family transposase-associated protein [Candidatus Nitrosopolaris sp.]